MAVFDFSLLVLSYALCKDCISAFHCFGVIFSPCSKGFCKRSRISGYLARLSKLSIFLVVINFSALSADCESNAAHDVLMEVFGFAFLLVLLFFRWLHAVLPVPMPAMLFLSFCLCRFYSKSLLIPHSFCALLLVAENKKGS